MSKKLRFILSGPGLIGKNHGKLIQNNEYSSLKAVVVPLSSPDRDYFASSGATHYTCIEDALNSEEFDAAIISSPNSSHFSQAMACIKKGLPTLIEKPITDNLEDALKIVKESENRNIPVIVGHHRAHSPLLKDAISFLNSPEFGQMVCVQGSALFYKPKKYFLDGEWRTKIGGGPILINLIHEIGLLRSFCGEIDSVYALSSNKTRKFDVEDTVAITFLFKSGVLGNFILSDTAASNKSWEMTSGENPMYPNYKDENCYHFAGTHGSLDFPSMRINTYGKSIEPSWVNFFENKRLDRSSKNPLEIQLMHFIDVIKGNSKPAVSAYDGYQNMLVIEAINRSIKSNVPIYVDRLNLY